MRASPALVNLLENRRHVLPWLYKTDKCTFKPPGFKPNYADMEMVYRTYYKGQDLTKYTHECAVRMSIALSINGFSFDRFDNKGRVLRGKPGRVSVPYVVGAEELANYLKKEWGPPSASFRGKAIKIAQKTIRGKRGVLYFNNCSNKKGDHIDLWTGEEFYNRILKIGTHSKNDDGSNLFLKSDRIIFWEVR